MRTEGLRISEEIAEILKTELTSLDAECAIAYSGGLDSTVLLAASRFLLNPYTVGALGSRDMQNARNASRLLKFRINEVTIEKNDVERYRKIISDLDPDVTKMELGYEIVLAVVLDHVREDRVVTGQGADELFYGYRRFIDDPGLDNSGHLDKLFRITLPREEKIAGYFGKTLITPYLNREIIGLSEKLGKADYIEDGKNKAILREVARILNLPDELADRPKKAAQYGSGVKNILSKT